MRISGLAVFSCLLIATACATTHPGTIGKVVEGSSRLPFKISAKSIDPRLEDSFQLMEVTIENTSDEWVKIKQSQVIINEAESLKIAVILGKELRDWASAMQYRINQDEYNQRMAQLGMIGAGLAATAAGSSTKNPGLAVAGSSMMVGTYIWAVSDILNQSYNSAVGTDHNPESHLQEPFSIPGKMYLRRWVLISKPSKTLINRLVVGLQTFDEKSSHYEIDIEIPNSLTP